MPPFNSKVRAYGQELRSVPRTCQRAACHATSAGSAPTRKRDLCGNCRRPSRVCICATIPPRPLKLRGKVIICQHPLEKKRSTATVRLLQQCLEDCEVIDGQHFSQLRQPALEAALEDAWRGRYPLYVLFPGPGVTDLATVAAAGLAQIGSSASTPAPPDPAQLQQQHPSASPQAWDQHLPSALGGAPGEAAGGGLLPQAPLPAAEAPAQPATAGTAGAAAAHPSDQAWSAPAPSTPAQGAGGCTYALVAIDGTWRQAREMYQSLEPHLVAPGGPGVRVQLTLRPAAQQQEHKGDGQPNADEQSHLSPGTQPCGQQAQQQQAPQQAQQQQKQQEQRWGGGELGGGGQSYLLMMEPLPGCVTTCEAVARALGILEGEEGAGVRESIMRPLARVMELQARWDPAVRARLAGEAAQYASGKRRFGYSGALLPQDIPVAHGQQ